MSDENDEFARTFVVNYTDENGDKDHSMRKRAEYQMREPFGEFFSPYEGMIRRFEGDKETFEEAYEAIAKKVGEENIQIERAEEVEMNDLSVSSGFNYDIGLNKEAVDGFLNYWFQTQAPKSEKVSENTYELNHKVHGLGSASYDTEETDSGTSLEVEWRAHTDEAVEGFAGLFEEELETFVDSQ
jgi:hypothetical protein